MCRRAVEGMEPGTWSEDQNQPDGSRGEGHAGEAPGVLCASFILELGGKLQAKAGDGGEGWGTIDAADGGDRQAGCCQGCPGPMMVPLDRPRGRHCISPQSLEPPPRAACLEHFLPSLFLQAGEDGPRLAPPTPGGTHSPVSALLSSPALRGCGRPGCLSSRHQLRGGPWAPLPQPRDPHNEPEARGIPPSVLIS